MRKNPLGRHLPSINPTDLENSLRLQAFRAMALRCYRQMEIFEWNPSPIAMALYLVEFEKFERLKTACKISSCSTNDLAALAKNNFAFQYKSSEEIARQGLAEFRTVMGITPNNK